MFNLLVKSFIKSFVKIKSSNFYIYKNLVKVVNAIHDFRGMALAGVGKKVRLYDFGKRKLLAKCENRVSEARL